MSESLLPEITVETWRFVRSKIDKARLLYGKVALRDEETVCILSSHYRGGWIGSNYVLSPEHLLREVGYIVRCI